MGSEIVPLIMIPVLFFMLLNFIFQQIIANTAQTYIDTLNCPFPDYNTSYDASCAGSFSHDPFVNDRFVLWNFTVGGGFWSGGADWNWEASIPTGVFEYVPAVISIAIIKLGAMLSLIALPFSLPSIIQGLSFLWVIEIPLFIMLGIGVYKGVVPT